MKSICTALLLTTTLSATAAYAHHSNAASFTDIPITVEGYVDEYLFKNPHVIVYLNVANKETGETTRWMAEGAAATGLRLGGWNDETFETGDYIRITGSSGRNNRPMVQLRQVNYVDPDTGATIREVRQERITVGPSDSSHPDFQYPAKKDNGLPNLDGIWVQGGPHSNPSFLDNEDPVFTPAGQAIQDTIRALNDPQYVKCERATLIRQAGFTPHPVKITQHDDRVVFEYEEYSGERVVYLDDREYGNFDPNERYIGGRYKAGYEGDSLVIESDLLTSGWSSIFGQVISDQASIVETYTREYDELWGPSVHLSMIITDPVNLAEPWEMKWNKYYTVSGFTGTESDNVQNDYVMLPVDCQIPLTAGTDVGNESIAVPDFGSVNGDGMGGGMGGAMGDMGGDAMAGPAMATPAAAPANTPAAQIDAGAGGSKTWLWILAALGAIVAIGAAFKKSRSK